MICRFRDQALGILRRCRALLWQKSMTFNLLASCIGQVDIGYQSNYIESVWYNSASITYRVLESQLLDSCFKTEICGFTFKLSLIPKDLEKIHMCTIWCHMIAAWCSTVEVGDATHHSSWHGALSSWTTMNHDGGHHQLPVLHQAAVSRSNSYWNVAELVTLPYDVQHEPEKASYIKYMTSLWIIYG